MYYNQEKRGLYGIASLSGVRSNRYRCPFVFQIIARDVDFSQVPVFT